jgi:hypothetical protein
LGFGSGVNFSEWLAAGVCFQQFYWFVLFISCWVLEELGV